MQRLSPEERALRRQQVLDEKKARRNRRREALLTMLDARKDFKGKLHNLVVATFVGLDDALLKDDVATAYECACKLGLIDSPDAFPEQLVRRARAALRLNRLEGSRKLDKVEMLVSMKYTCPKCNKKYMKFGSWVWPKKDRNGTPVCRGCGYRTKPGFKTDVQPPADMICPVCKRHRPLRRMWAMKKRPLTCRKCSRRV